MSEMSLMFPLGSIAKRLVSNDKKKNAMTPSKQDMTVTLVVSIIVALIIIGVAVWMASECNSLVDYILAVAFPFNYIMIRLLAPCRS